MSGTNHVAGGIVFTGIFASFWNINIFSKVEYLSLCTFFSVLPDIDHTRSLIGKLFYPVAKYLDRHFGHRTITHSLPTLISLAILLSILEKLFRSDLNLTLLYTLSYSSHLILDMMTVGGVPLFYPFRRNPCVIPGNPAMRFKSGDLKTEIILLAFFLLAGTTCRPLFKHGFWTSINRAFGTLGNTHREFMACDKLIELSYNCSHLGQHYTGKGYLVMASPQEAIVYQNGVFLIINRDFKISTLIPTRTAQDYKTEEVLIHKLPLKELRALLHNKPIIDLHLQSTCPINFVQGKRSLTGTQIDLAYVHNPQLHPSTDHAEALQQQSTFEKKRCSINTRIAQITHTAHKMDSYTRQKATEELRHLKAQLKELTEASKLSPLHNKPTIFSGYLRYLVLD